MCELRQNLKLHPWDNIEYLHNLGVAVHFLKMIPTAKTMKGKNENVDVIKTRNFWSLKSINKREKEWRRYSTYNWQVDLYPEYTKNPANPKEKNPFAQNEQKKIPYVNIVGCIVFFLPVAGFNQFVLDHWHSLVAGLGNCLIPWPLSTFSFVGGLWAFL